MTIIPIQLANCRFIKTHGKFPYEKDWTTINNYGYQASIPEDTYGVCTGIKKLVVVDCDKQYIQDKLLEIEQIRNTFTVQTAGKKLNHFYFYVDIENPKSFSLDDKNGERVLDFQAKGKMVVGPNSKLSTGNSYNIVNDSDIAIIPYNFLKNILMNIDDGLKIFEKEDKSDIKAVYFDFDDMCVKIKEKITVRDILLKNNIDAVSSGNCMCPLGHGSDGGKCFSYTKIVWNCFHCHQSGNIFHLLMKIKKINFIDAKRQLAVLAGISDEVNNKILLNYADTKTRYIASELTAKEFMKLYKVYTIRGDKESEIYIYREGIFVPEGKTYIKEFIRSILGSLYNENFTKIVTDKIIVDSFIEKERFFINEDINLVPVQNGVLNITTLEIEDFSSKYRFFNKLPVIFDPIIEPDKTVQFVKDIVKTGADVDTIQELAGYLLYRENTLEKSFMLLGKGRNGKSKLIELFIKLIGDENKTNVSLSMIENDNFSIINLHNKYANFSPDISKEALENTGTFKSLVGREVMTANRKFKEPLEFKNYAKMIFAANDLPQSKDISDGFWDRWIIIDFPYKFEDEPTLPHHKKKDMNIIDKISSTRELSGFLNWSLEGLARLLKNKQFTLHKNTNEIRNKWLSESNTFAKFWFDEIIFTNDSNDMIFRDDIISAYNNYCLENKIEKENGRTIYFFINQNCLYIRKRVNGEMTYVLKKVKFKTYIPEIKIKEDVIQYDG